MKRHLLFLLPLLATFQLRAQDPKTARVDVHTNAVCDMCVKTIETELVYEKGVKSVKVDLATNTIHVGVDPRKTDAQKVRTAISKLGYAIAARRKVAGFLPCPLRKSSDPQGIGQVRRWKGARDPRTIPTAHFRTFAPSHPNRPLAMALIRTLRGITPVLGDDCFLAETATVIGDVVMGERCSVWYNAVVRGDVNAIRIGDRVNIQDGAVLHCTYQKAALTIGNDVSIGHNAIAHGCTIKDRVLVGMGAIVMDHAVIGEGSVIAAGAVVLQNTVVEPGSLMAGVPARRIGPVSAELSANEIERIAKNYLMYAGWFKEG